ncbi:unnamed protein product [Caenorhabditis angaria]|uniref:protein-tyrosine-phosphatase n=1 Tax=Caenorhabditis angaria TaxID=860376 RepID=A0A9P1MY83_9PELO|nr:unnamed protein product [Caenorhabditis angaria]
MFLLTPVAIFLLTAFNCHSIQATSTIHIDYSSFALSSPNPQAYIIEYSPPVGYPPTGSAVEGTTHFTNINGTISATEYTVSISAILGDGTRKNLADLSVFSSPDPPKLDSIETTEHEATISYFPPQGQNITFQLEYYPEDHQEYANSIDTKAALVRLRGLDSGTVFRLKIRSLYKNVYSNEIIDTTFQTQGQPNYDYSSNSAESFSVKTLPPSFNLPTTTSPSNPSSEYYSTEEEDTESTTNRFTFSFVPSTTPNYIDDEEYSTTEVKTKIETTSTPTSTTTTTKKSTTTKTKLITTTTTSAKKMTAIEVNSGDMGDEYPTELASSTLTGINKMTEEYGEPAEIVLSDENEMLRMDWDVPDHADCEAFFVNYTILTLNHPKSFSVATSDQHANIKMFPEHTLDIRVFCMLAGALSKTWWAHRIAHLSKPRQIENAKIVQVLTDDFYVASITFQWEWPYHDFNYYKIVISYGTAGKSTDGQKELEIVKYGSDNVTISDLDPSQLYTISIRNASTELSLSSKAVQLQQVTAPIISSTVYPGQISSNSININFGDSDGKFDYYLLTFSGNNKNISKKVELEHEKSFTFTKLIPGKTYQFSVYTVYKGVRSRPVSSDITTYPVKVNQLFPVVGKDYVILYWDIENFADSDCRFRLSYNADNVDTVSVELKGASRHRFSNLQSEVYYTFTITVIMGIGQAAAESESEMITVAIPKGRLTPTVSRQGSRELVVGFDNDQSVFSLLNGSPDNFAVIVSDDISLNDDNYESKSWFEVKDEDVWGSYRASPSTWNPFDNERIRRASFTVGTDDCVKRNLDEPYCNGILRANTDYRVKIRMYTDTKVAMETDWGRIEGYAKNDEEGGGEEEEEEDDRRFPCHMYLNGCSGRRRKSSSNLQPFTLLISSFSFLLIFLL